MSQNYIAMYPYAGAVRYELRSTVEPRIHAHAVYVVVWLVSILNAGTSQSSYSGHDVAFLPVSYGHATVWEHVEDSSQASVHASGDESCCLPFGCDLS